MILIHSESPIRATVKTKPRVILPVIHCDNAVLPLYKTVIAKLSLNVLIANTVVPVHKKMNNTTLLQETSTDWDRQLITSQDLGKPHFFSPVILSARNRWHLKDNTSEIFDRAVVIDGAKRLEVANMFDSIIDIPIMIIYGLRPDDELVLRHQLNNTGEYTSIETRKRVGTTAPRLVIKDNWISIEVLSDPFVVPTSRGYAPAILIQRSNAYHAEYIFIAAKSIAVVLEKIRLNRNTLRGVRLMIRKTGLERTSTYQLRVTNSHTG